MYLRYLQRNSAQLGNPNCFLSCDRTSQNGTQGSHDPRALCQGEQEVWQGFLHRAVADNVGVEDTSQILRCELRYEALIQEHMIPKRKNKSKEG